MHLCIVITIITTIIIIIVKPNSAIERT